MRKTFIFSCVLTFLFITLISQGCSREGNSPDDCGCFKRFYFETQNNGDYELKNLRENIEGCFPSSLKDKTHVDTNKYFVIYCAKYYD